TPATASARSGRSRTSRTRSAAIRTCRSRGNLAARVTGGRCPFSHTGPASVCCQETAMRTIGKSQFMWSRRASHGAGAAILVRFAVAACNEKPAPPPPPPPEVYVADVVQRDVPEFLELVGQTAGFQDVDIRARVEGFLETVNFQEGTFVRKGALLYQID